MSEFGAGGPANIAGIDYQLWFTVLKLVEAITGKELTVSPEAKVIADLNGGVELTAVDDLSITENGDRQRFNIKRASALTNWTLKELQRKGVIGQFLKELNISDASIFFVSESPTELDEVFSKVRNASSVEEIPERLGKLQSERWNEVLETFDVEETKMMQWTERIFFERYRQKDLMDLIDNRLLTHFSKPLVVRNALYQFAKEAAKHQRTNIGGGELERFLAEKGLMKMASASVTQIREQFHLASSLLRTEHFGFGDLIDTYIPRTETNLILDWIHGDLAKNDLPIATVVGGAGSGKSNVMRDLLKEFEESDIPCLGIKAEKDAVKSCAEFDKRMGFEQPFLRMIANLANDSAIPRVVVLIDQIDALSQSITNDRKALSFYLDLVARLQSISASTEKKIRVVISCRKYDLSTDPSLKRWKSTKSVEIGQLSEVAVKSVLKLLHHDAFEVSPDLLDLLRTPLHLDLYASISPDARKREFAALEGLYDAFWTQKLQGPDLGAQLIAQLRAAIQKAVNEMMNEQKLETSMRFALGREQEVKYLQSCGILRKREHGISFFHQTFFDYAFARLFTENGGSIKDISMGGKEGLFARSKIKMILSYLRGFSTTEYKNALEEILSDPNIRFHLKLLAIEQIAWQEFPNNSEKRVFDQCISISETLRWAFLQSCNSAQWLCFLIKAKYLGVFVKELSDTDNDEKFQSIAALLNRCQAGAEEDIFRFLQSLEEDDLFENLKVNFIHFLKNWDHQLAVEVISGLETEKFPSWVGVLKTALSGQKKWAITRYKKDFEEAYEKAIENGEVTHLKARFFNLNSGWREYNDMPFLREAFHVSAVDVFQLALHIHAKCTMTWEVLGHYEKKGEKTLIGGNGFLIHHEEDLPSNEGPYSLPGVITEMLKTTTGSNPELFLEMIEEIKPHRHKGLYISILKAFGELSGIYENEILNFFEHLDRFDVWTEETEINFIACQVAASAFPLWSLEGKRRFTTLVRSINASYLTTDRLGSDKNAVSLLKYYGKHKYRLLSQFKRNGLQSHLPLWHLFLELERKFEHRDYQNPYISTRWSSIKSPIQKDRILRMSKKTFLKTVKHFDREQIDNWNHTGGATEYAREIEEAAKKDANRIAAFVEAMIKTEAPEVYIAYGLHGLQKANYDIQELERLFLAAIPLVQEDDLLRFMLWGARHLVRKGQVGPELITYLELSSNHSDPSEDKGDEPMQQAINSIRGIIAESVPLLFEQTEFEDRVFELAEKLANDHTVAVRAALMQNLGLLTRLNYDRTFAIFETLSSTPIPGILSHSAQILSFFAHKDWEKIRPLLKSICGIDTVQDAVGQILFFAVQSGYAGASLLLDTAKEQFPKVKSGAIRAATHTMIGDANTTDRENARNFVIANMDLLNSSIRHKIQFSFHEIQPEGIKFIRPVINEYLKNVNGECKALYLLELLEKAALHAPEEVIEVLDLVRRVPDLNHILLHQRNDLPEIVLLAYNGIRDYTRTNDLHVMLALDLIDFTLQHADFQHNARKMVSEIY